MTDRPAEKELYRSACRISLRLVFRLGAWRGRAVNQERWGMWGGSWDSACGDRPNSAVRLSHGSLPSAQLPMRLEPGDSL